MLLTSANMSAMLLYIITNAVLFSFLMTSEQIPQAMAAWMVDRGLGTIGFLVLVNVMLLLAGNVMEPSSIILIMAPILFPVAVQAGHRPDPLRHPDDGEHGGGLCHPPVGLNLVRRLRHREDGDHRADHRGLAVAARRCWCS